MITTAPSMLRLRLLSLQPHLAITEIQLVDDVLFYERIDRRDHVPTEVRAVRPQPAEWARFRVVLDAAGFWSWPRRGPCVPNDYKGEFAVGVLWNGSAAVSAGPIGVAREVDSLLDSVLRLVGKAPPRTSQAVATLRGADPPPPKLPEKRAPVSPERPPTPTAA